MSPLHWLAIPVVVTLIAAVAVPLWRRRQHKLSPADRAAKVRRALVGPPRAEAAASNAPRSPGDAGSGG